MRKWLLGLVLSFFAFSDFLLASAFVSGSGYSEEELPIYQEKDQSVSQFASAPSLLGREVQVVFLLLLLAGVFYLTLLFIKKLGRDNLETQESSESFKILGQHTLVKGKKIIVAEIYSQVVLLSESAGSLQFLYEIKEQEIKDRILLDYSSSLVREAKLGSLSFYQLWQDRLRHLKHKFKPLSGRRMTGVKNEEKLQKPSYLEDKEVPKK